MTRPAATRPAARLAWLRAAAAAAAIVTTLAIPSLSAGAAAAASPPHPAAAASGGTLRAWGLNDLGQLGDGSSDDASAVPVKVKLPPGTRVTSARAGCEYSLALTRKHKVFAWGDNRAGELGDGTTTASDTPVRVHIPAGTKITAIRAGCGHALALTSKGKVLAWGFNSSGELGDGTHTQRDTPVRVRLPAGTKVRGIGAGSLHSLAVTAKGKVLAWGGNDFGQLGNGTTANSDRPVRVRLPHGTKVTAVAAGDSHSLARTTKGKVLAWGIDGSGELGNGSASGSSDVPVRVLLPSGTRVRGLAAGCNQSLALTTAGSVLAWGQNNFGQLGDGSTGDSSDTPVAVALPQGARATAVSAGCTHSLALISDGEVLAWGERTAGRLGDGTMTGSSDTPVSVQIPAGLAAITIGSGPDAGNSLVITRKAAL